MPANRVIIGLCKRLFCHVDDDDGYGKEMLIGLAINKRETEISMGVPKDQACRFQNRSSEDGGRRLFVENSTKFRNAHR